MGDITEKEAVEMLRKYSTSNESFNKVLNHSRAVQKLALEIAKDIKKNHDVDMDFVKIASLLHDIGRFKCYKENSIRHGVVGGEILSKQGLTKHARIAETHIGVGITKQDIEKQGLNLPLRHFMPETTEEKISVLRRVIDEREKDWELIQIGAPLKNNIPITFRKRNESDQQNPEGDPLG